MKSNPTPTLPLSGEGAKDKNAATRPQTDANTAPPLAPPPEKGEAGRGLSNKTRLHNLKPQINNRRQNRKNPTEPEKRFWSWVRGKQLGCKFRRQHGIGQYIVDFYCTEQALIVELDGDSHYTPEAVAYDIKRTQFLMSKGFKVMRFSNLEIMQNKEGVLSQVLVCLNTGAIKSNPSPALPLSGEGVKDKSSATSTSLAPPSEKGEVGRGLMTKKAEKKNE
ncbi:MAG: hypothetical protein methR_P2234 [Methyloprofundus sp.]|nr:MAG: hypothetical protein methR_P2234 [Methyloprofundus sp.]